MQLFADSVMVCVQSFAKAAAEEAAAAAAAAAEAEEGDASADAEAEATSEGTGSEARPSAASVYGALKDGMAAVRAAVEVGAPHNAFRVPLDRLSCRGLKLLLTMPDLCSRIHRRRRSHRSLNQSQKAKNDTN